MATKHAEIFGALSAPYDTSDVKTLSKSGRSFSYVTARVVMNRLDEVLGPENWWDTYAPHENSVLCHLTIRLPDGETISKADAGGYAGMADSGDDDKSGYSDAFKRAAVKFGVGRYLYRDGSPDFGFSGGQEHHAPAPQQRQPDRREAVVDQYAQHRDERRPQANGNGQGGGGNKYEGQAPRSGKGMFAWAKEQGTKHEVDLIKYLNQWAKLSELPGRMVDWDADQVQMAYVEACRKLGLAPAQPAARAAAPGGRAEDHGRPDYDDSDAPVF